MKAFVSTLVLSAGIAFTLTACAHPNYQASSEAPEADVKPGTSCALKFNSQNLCAAYDWEKYPTESETGAFVARFTNPTSGALIDPALSLKVILWMPSMGHGSSPVTVTRLSTGVYRVDRVFFSMPGVWQIRFQLIQAAAVVEEQIATLQF